jgi:hypothetical protein
LSNHAEHWTLLHAFQDLDVFVCLEFELFFFCVEFEPNLDTSALPATNACRKQQYEALPMCNPYHIKFSGGEGTNH